MKWEYRFTSRETILSVAFWWLPRNLERPLGTGLRNIIGPFPIYEHSHSLGHCINVDSFSIVGREVHGITRTIKEAILIRVNDPSLNKNLGRFQLPNIWDEILQNTPTLHLRQYSATTPQWVHYPMPHSSGHILFTLVWSCPWEATPFWYQCLVGYSICHLGKYHLPQNSHQSYKMALPTATVAIKSATQYSNT